MNRIEGEQNGQDFNMQEQKEKFMNIVRERQKEVAANDQEQQAGNDNQP